jgi:hypothetical protein
MDGWLEVLCPDCERPLRRLVPPECLPPDLIDLYKCPECVVLADRFGQTVECGKIFLYGEDGMLQPAPDMVQWLLADE